MGQPSRCRGQSRARARADAKIAGSLPKATKLHARLSNRRRRDGFPRFWRFREISPRDRRVNTARVNWRSARLWNRSRGVPSCVRACASGRFRSRLLFPARAFAHALVTAVDGLRFKIISARPRPSRRDHRQRIFYLTLTTPRPDSPARFRALSGLEKPRIPASDGRQRRGTHTPHALTDPETP